MSSKSRRSQRLPIADEEPQEDPENKVATSSKPDETSGSLQSDISNRKRSGLKTQAVEKNDEKKKKMSISGEKKDESDIEEEDEKEDEDEDEKEDEKEEEPAPVFTRRQRRLYFYSIREIAEKLQKTLRSQHSLSKRHAGVSKRGEEYCVACLDYKLTTGECPSAHDNNADRIQMIWLQDCKHSEPLTKQSVLNDLVFLQNKYM